MFIPIILHSCFGSDFVFPAVMVQVSLSRACVSLCRMLAQVGLVGNMYVQTKEIGRSFRQRESPNWYTYRYTYTYIRCIPKRIHRLTFRLPASSETRKRAYSLVSDEAAGDTSAIVYVYTDTDLDKLNSIGMINVKVQQRKD